MKKAVLILFVLLQIICLQAQTTAPVEIMPGVPLLNRGKHWDRRTFERLLAARRIFFNGTPLMRSAFLHNRRIFGVPAVEMRVSYTEAGFLSQVDLIYANKGDSGDQKNVSRQIQRTASLLNANLTAVYGEPQRKQYGLKRMRNRVSFWQKGIVEIVLDYIRGEYVIVHIHVGDQQGGKAGEEKEEDSFDLKGKDFSGNVKKNDFGDVFIPNIPMVNQGNKGYCVPATVERVLRYYGITQVDMHRLADAAKTKKGGGTSLNDVFNGLASFRRAAGLKKFSGGDLRMNMVKKYIDQGIPIFWVMYVNPQYEAVRADSRRMRSSARSAKAWKKQIRRLKVPARGEPHMCLVIGYNDETEEIAVTNSWGNREIVPSWVPLKIARRVSQGRTFVLAPR